MKTIDRNKWAEGTVVENHAWNDHLFSLKIDAEINPYTAGQFTRLGLEVDGEHIARPYSLVNKDHKSPLEIYFNEVDGPLSPKLANLKEGDSIDVSKKPVGFFTLNDVPDGKDLWLLATGTGLGPYIAMLATDTVWETFERITLVHGVGYIHDLGYADFLQTLEKQKPGKFSYFPGVTREKNSTGINRRIPASITSGELEELTDLSLSAEDSRVMICGNIDMIRETIEVLEERGLKKHKRTDPGQIITEKYW